VNIFSNDPYTFDEHHVVCPYMQSSKGPIEVYLCPEEVAGSDANTTMSSNPDSACSNTSASSGDDSFFSEDSTSCDSFKGLSVVSE